MVRITIVNEQTILDVYPNDSYGEMLVKVEEIGKMCSNAHIDALRRRDDEAVKELFLDFKAFENCGGVLRVHSTEFLDSSYVTIGTAEEYVTFCLSLL